MTKLLSLFKFDRENYFNDNFKGENILKEAKSQIIFSIEDAIRLLLGLFFNISYKAFTEVKEKFLEVNTAYQSCIIKLTNK